MPFEKKMFNKKRLPLQYKVLFVYFILVVVIGSMTTTLLHECKHIYTQFICKKISFDKQKETCFRYSFSQAKGYNEVADDLCDSHEYEPAVGHSAAFVVVEVFG